MNEIKYCYCTDETYAYSHKEIAQENPREEGEYILPPGGTLVPIPTEPWLENTWPKWSNNKWEMVPDYREQVFYKIADGTPVSLGIGEKPDTTMTAMEPQPGEVWDDSPSDPLDPSSPPVGWKETRTNLVDTAIAVAKAHRDTLWETGTVKFKEKEFRCDANMQAVISAINSSFATSLPEVRPWTAVDETEMNLSHDDFIAMSLLEIERRDLIFVRYKEILSQIRSVSPALWSDTQMKLFIDNPESIW